MPLSQSQRKYAMERIQAIVSDKLKRIEAETKRIQDLSPQDKCDMILSGEAVFCPEKVSPTYSRLYEELPNISDVYLFPAQDRINAQNRDMAESQESRKAKLRASAAAIKDQVMLSNSSDGLKVISQFARRKF